MKRDKLLLAVTGLFVAAVLAGYGWILATDNSFSRLDFGMGTEGPPALPAYLKGRVERSSAAGRWAAGERTAKIRSFMRDEFIGYDRILTGYSSAVTGLNTWFFGTFRPSVPIVPMGIENAKMFVYTAENALVPARPGSVRLAREVPANVAAVRRMTEAHPDVTFVFYGVPPWGMTDIAAGTGYRDANVTAWDRFVRDAEPYAEIGELKVTSWSEYFFATDHHWNPRGAYQGFLDMAGLLQEGDPDLVIKRPPFSERVVDEVEFRGSNSRRSAYLGMSEPFRAFTGYDAGVHAFIDGEQRDDVISPKGYFENPPNKVFKGHYATYNGGEHALIEFRSEAKGAGNLLLFGDSFSNAMEDMLAASFGKSYCVDLRYYESEFGEPFDLDEFIAEHGITHVAFLSRPATVMEMPRALEEKRPLE